MQVIQRDIEVVMEGAYFESLGGYIILRRSGNKINRIILSTEYPLVHSNVAERIIAHLEGRASRPEVDLDLSRLTIFQKEVFAVVREIPRGKTLTYGEVARLANKPKAARAVGSALAANPFALLIPCHRVVSSSGLGGYSWGRDIKEKLLALESI